MASGGADAVLAPAGGPWMGAMCQSPGVAYYADMVKVPRGRRRWDGRLIMSQVLSLSLYLCLSHESLSLSSDYWRMISRLFFLAGFCCFLP